ncbi:THO complex subunit 4A-like isoform X1 [Camellia sinensis]|uniref:THO complex subunit 4A-like isoform X1 n=1 Tax=Camellia sinensis TaxID=4442 RepID=UPI001036455B|nr:THO complex subunit 4A-like isoform X1 [Camellia sinensis]
MSNLDMSLDDIIKMNKKSGGGGGGGGGGGANPRGRARNSGPGPARRLPNRSSNRTTPYSAGKVQAPETTWQHDMFADHATAAYPAQVGRVSAIETGTKLFISNLDYGVSNEDIKELFAEVGDLKRYSIHYDRSGRSKGTAEVVFSRRKNAEEAVKRYNNVQLDGKPMKIDTVGTNITTSAAPPPSTNGMYGDQNGAPRRHLLLSNESSQGRGGGALGRLQGGGGGGGGAIGRPRGGGRGSFGRGRERGGRGRVEKVSPEDLDADLEKYHAEAMQTN